MNKLFFTFAASSGSRDGNVILFQWHHCDSFTNIVFTWIVQFFKITFHMSSNHDWKKQWISHFFKYQFCSIKNKFNMLDKNNHHKISTFQQIKFFNHKMTLRFNDDSMCTHILLIFAACIFFFFSNWWSDWNKKCFFAFHLYVFLWWNVSVNDDVNVWLRFSNFLEWIAL